MTKKQPSGALHYIGDGSALDNVPARDLSADEAAQYDAAALITSGLYEAAPTDDAPQNAAKEV